jgi:hypothetical protein
MKKILLIILLFAFSAIQAQDKPPTGSNFVLVGNSVYFNKADQTLWLYKSKPLGWTQIATSKNVKFKLDSIMSLISSTAPVYPVLGIAVSSGTSWSPSIVDNSTQWNNAWYSGNHPTVFADYGLTGGILTTPLIGTEIRMTGEENYATADFFTYNGDGTGAYGVSVISYIGANRKLFKVGFDTGNDDGFMVDWDHSTARFKYKFNLGDILLNGDISAVNETLTGDLAGTSMSMVAPLGTASVTGWTWNGDAESVYGTNAIGYLGANRKIFRVGTYLGSNGFTVDWLHDAGRFAYNFNIGDANVSGNVTASSFVKLGGTSNQMLMADGSVSTGGDYIFNQTSSPQIGGAWTTSPMKIGSPSMNTSFNTDGFFTTGNNVTIYADAGRKLSMYSDGYNTLTLLANHNVETMSSLKVGDSYGFAIGTYPNYRRITFDNNTGTFRALTTANAGAIFSASSFVSDVAIGTSPFNIASTTMSNNLNADLLDGQHGNYYASVVSLNNYLLKTGGTLTGPLVGTSGVFTSVVQGSQLKSSIAMGTPPLIVNSPTMVYNLNAELWSGEYFSSAGINGGFGTIMVNDGMTWGATSISNFKAVLGLNTLPVVSSGTYTPSAINIANTSAHWIESASYIRVGNIVHCQVDGTVVASSANTDTTLALDLPFVSTVNQTGVLLGVGSLININNSNPNPSVDVSRTSGYAQMYFSYKSTSAGDQVSFSIQFDYQL